MFTLAKLSLAMEGALDPLATYVTRDEVRRRMAEKAKGKSKMKENSDSGDSPPYSPSKSKGAGKNKDKSHPYSSGDDGDEESF